MDKIYIRDLSVRTLIGTYEWEQEHKQDLIFNIELRSSLREAGIADDLDRTVNYKEVRDKIVKLAEDSSYKLIEALAESTAETCLEFEGIESVKITLDKPGALRYAKSVAVEIERFKQK
ncbi:MAG: dihydroneopterin aldolase [Lentisphaerae bacterium GWF2_45_14]|nr:MAG: dihydroneopterin aldolase [Lentisphaerae bacterium GWF2_45_14]